MNPTTIGFVAGILTSIASIPQVIKTLKSRHVRDISIWQPLLLAFGVGLWMAYGFLINDLPLILANITPLICNIVLTGMKIRYGREDQNSLPHHHTGQTP
ncbi:MAG: SemiSWEET family sugar transporter [Deltaproteobacteria bacterium]|jgi:MtN3 and saliva related transmembrane protein|nr:SemiSWEET family sugar transporter [Deltaproteobacteria bacterium]